MGMELAMWEWEGWECVTWSDYYVATIPQHTT